MRCAALLVLVTGCRAVLGLESPELVDAPTVDTPRADAASDASLAQKVCDQDTNLVACFDFEGDATDHAPSPNAVTASNVSFSNEGVNGGAIVVGTASRLTISESVLLDVPSVTVEAWVYLTEAPQALSRSGVLDVNGQYGVFIRDTLTLTCTPGTPFDAGNVLLDQWTHVACTASGGMAAAYINGTLVGTMVYSGQSLPTSGTDGGEIAGNSPGGQERLVGKLDVLRVYRVARTAEQICHDAGKMSCN